MRARTLWIVTLVGLVGVGLAAASPGVGAQSSTVTVSAEGFELSCPASGAEGAVLTCTLTNNNSSAAPWPVVALLHGSKDADRALVRGAAVDASFGTLSPSASIDGGVWWIGDLLVGYSRFDWGLSAAAGASRTVLISLVDDDAFEGAEQFYVGLGPDRSRAVGKLWNSRSVVAVEASDAKSSDASLGSASVRVGPSMTDLSSSDLGTSPVSYSMSVDYESTDASVSVEPAHDQAEITGVAVTHGASSPFTVNYDDASGSAAFKLAVGTTTVSVTVRAEDGTTQSVHTITINRAALSGTHVTVTHDPFTLTCPAEVNEGSLIECILANDGQSRAPWPVVGLLHSSMDADRATVAGDPQTPASGSSYSQDASFASYQPNPVDRFRFGHGELFSGSSRSGRATYGYEKFDWEGSAAVGESRRVWVQTSLNDSDELLTDGDEILYVALAAHAYSGLRELVDNKAPVVIADPDKGIASVSVDAAASNAATVTITATNAETGDNTKFRYRAAGASAWTELASQPASSAAAFVLAGLTAGTTYRVQTSLDNDYTTRAEVFFTTAAAAVDSLTSSAVSDTTAVVTATVTGTLEGLQVHLRHRLRGTTNWVTLPPKAAATSIEFDLAGLLEGAQHEVEASTSRHFSAAVRHEFATTPHAFIDEVAARPSGRSTATVTVRATRVYVSSAAHVRYKKASDVAWTTLDPKAFRLGPVGTTVDMALFGLTGLVTDTDYQVEASLHDDFSSSVTESFTSWRDPSVASVTAEATGKTAATVTVELSDNRLSDTVHLRYKKTTEADWTTATSLKAYARVTFSLDNLDEGATYQAQASLSSSFSTTTEASFQTFQSMSIGSVTAKGSGYGKAEVTVRLPDDVAGTVRMRLKKTADENWGEPMLQVAATPTIFESTGLEDATEYDVQVSLDTDFASHVDGSFATWRRASITSVTVPVLGRFSVRIGVTVSDHNPGELVRLRYRRLGSGWTTAPDRAAAERVEFSLVRLDANFRYEVQVWLASSGSASATTLRFRTASQKVASVSAEATGHSTASVTVGAGDFTYSVYLRYTPTSGGDVTTVQSKSTGVRRAKAPLSAFNLTGLEPSTDYDVEVSTAKSFSTTSTRTVRFSTWGDASIGSVSASVSGSSTASVTVAVSEVRSSDTVHLRYKESSDSQWTVVAPQEAASSVTFDLTGLNADTSHSVEASLASNFVSSVSRTFTTERDVSIGSVSASVSGRSTASVTVTVEGFQSGDQVFLRYRASGGGWSSTSPMGASSVTFDLTGLDAGTSYDVQASLSAGFASPYDGTFTTWRQVSISSLTATSTTRDSAELTVMVSEIRSGDTLHLRYKESSGSQWTVVASQAAASSVTFDLTGLDAGTSYDVQVSLDVQFSAVAEVSVTTERDASIGSVSASVSGRSTASVTVTVEDFQSGDQVFLRYRASGGGWSSTSSMAAASSVAFDLTGLDAGTSYDVQAALSAGFASPYDGTFTTWRQVSISSFTATSTTRDSAELTVMVSDIRSGDTVHLRYKESSGSQWTVVASQAAASSVAFDLTGLDAGTSYVAQASVDGSMFAQNSYSERPFTTLAQAGVSSVLADSDDRSTASVTVMVSDVRTGDTVHLRYKESSGSQWTVVASQAAASSVAFDLTGLDAGTSYDVQVSLDMQFSTVAEVSVTTERDASIGSVSASVSGRSTASVTVMVSDVRSGDTVHLRYKESSGSQWTVVASQAAASSVAFDLTGLDAGTSYDVQAALSAGFASPYDGTFTTWRQVSISSLTATSTTRDSAELTVMVSDIRSGDTVHLRYKESSGSQWTVVASMAAASSVAFDLTGLDAGTSYDVQAALSAGFASPYDGTFTTWRQVSISSFTATSTTRDSAELTVMVSDIRSGDTVHLRYKESSGSQWTVVASQAAASSVAFDLTGLDAGTSYVAQASVDGSMFAQNSYSERPFTTLAQAGVSSVLADSDDRSTASVTVMVSDVRTGDTVHLRYKESSGSQWTVVASQAAASSVAFDLTGLDAGTSYDVQVSLDMQFSTVAEVSVTTERDASIGSVLASVSGRSTASVTVMVSDVRSGDTVHLRYKESSGSQWTVVASQAAASSVAFDLTGLDAGTSYDVQVSLDMQFSTVAEVSVTTERDASIGSVSASVSGRSTASVTVTVEGFQSGDQVFLRYRASGGGWSSTSSMAAASSVAFDLTGLDAGTSYDVQAALSAGFASPYDGTFTTWRQVSISSFTATSTTRDSAELTVMVSDIRSGDTVHLRYKESSGSQWTVVASQAAASSVAFDLTGLDAGTSYLAQASVDGSMFAQNSYSERPFTTLAQAGVSSVAASVSGRSSASVTVMVSDVRSGDTVHLRYKESSGSLWTVVASQAAASSVAFDLTGLDAGTSYDVQVSLDVQFSTVAEVSVTTERDASIGSVSASVSGRSTASVTVAVEGFQSGDQVFLRYRASGGGWSSTSSMAAASSVAFDLTGLDAGTSYDVQAALSAGFASPHDGTFDTWRQVSISSFTATSTTRDSAEVTVMVSDVRSGDTVHLRYKKSSGSQWTVVASQAAASSVAFELTGLDAGTSYDVQAALSAGFASPHDGTFVTLGTPAPQPPPAPPAGFVGGSPGGGGGGGGGGEPEPAEPPVASSARFVDVVAGSYYQSAVGWMVDNEVTVGCEADRFCPHQTATRAHFVTFLWRAAGRPGASVSGVGRFSDVGESSYFEPAVAWAVEVGVTVGCGDGSRFCPHRRVTRGEVAAFLHRFARAEHAASAASFDDVDRDDYFFEAVEWMVANAITNGCDQRRFCPSRPATRAHVAAFLHRYYTQRLGVSDPGGATSGAGGSSSVFSRTGPYGGDMPMMPHVPSTGLGGSVAMGRLRSTAGSPGPAERIVALSGRTAAIGDSLLRTRSRLLRSNGDPVAAAEIRIMSDEFELLPMQQLSRGNLGFWPSKPPNQGHFARVSVDSGGANVALEFSVTGQPDKSTYVYCYVDRDDCQDAEIHAELATGHLFVGLDISPTDAGTVEASAYLADWPEQPIELAVHRVGTGHKVYRDALVKPAASVPDCSDYTPETPDMLGCLMLGELLPTTPPATTSALRNALPDLLQPKQNYSLVFAEEFNGGLELSESGCMHRLASIEPHWNFVDPCYTVDEDGVPCLGAEDGYLYQSRTSRCSASLGTIGKASFKYGYLEYKYEVDAVTIDAHSMNSSVVMGIRRNMAAYHDRYGINVTSWEDLLKYEEPELDFTEYVYNGSNWNEVSHQYVNRQLTLSDQPQYSSTTKVLDLCDRNYIPKSYWEPVLLKPPGCEDRTKTIEITKGIEWTPKGFRSFYSVKDATSDVLIDFKKSQIEIFGKQGAVLGSARDAYFELVNSDDPESVYEKFGVAHMPLPLTLSTWAQEIRGADRNRVQAKFRIHYIRLFQPTDHYADVEPTYR